ncbi:hypothetical protein [Aliivibrio fischeri]|uniref:hypothetical protein n=1 Tax=Aliivibrio fischeri TaxID=668 RepID=UPI0007C4C925|nr:hypothetical protein [Aliivibrio fischeri]MCE7554908.1 hypothetical protein [Aliivibrio fischeri]MCE7562176.1 hypothetical protein [Aliivibrio fischeri]MCE7565610.1 hypothetical protein [Aliivibrio fischeri]MCE7569584.1 hypothetical protein [Aliivibrio fischeri]
MNKVFISFLYLCLISLSTLSVAGKSLIINVNDLKNQDLTSVPPLLIGENGTSKVSETIFTNEKITLEQPIAESEPRKRLKIIVNGYISKSKEILDSIKDGSFIISDISQKNELLVDLRNNSDFLRRTIEFIDSDTTFPKYNFHITKFKGNTLVITKTYKYGDELDISLVMSNPENLVNNKLKLTGGIKRASVENVRSIARDVVTNEPSMKLLSAYVVSPTLESNYRRFGFTEELCNE